jgi:hypothetical protein
MNLAITYGLTPGFAAAAAVAAILLSAQGATPGVAAVTQTVAPGTPSATFSNLPADTYTFTATPVDVNGDPLVAAGYTPPTAQLAVSGGGGGTGGTVSLSVPTALVATGP